MRILTNCPNIECLEKNSMVSVTYLDKQQKSDKVAFYICLKCSKPNNLEKIPFANQISMFEILVLRGSDQYEIENLQKTHNPKCILCKKSKAVLKESRSLTNKEAKQIQKNNPDKTIEHILSHTSQEEDVTRKSIVKLYIEAQRLGISRQYAGYLCLSCKRIFFIKNLPKFQWKNLSWKDQSGNYLPEQNGLDFMSPQVKFGTLGAYSTRSAPFGPIEQEKIPHITKAQIRKVVREELAKLGLLQ